MDKLLNLKKYLILTIFSLLTAHCSLLTAQDFGFGFDDGEEEASGISFSFGGEIKIEFPYYFKDYKFEWQEIGSGKINFNVNSQYIEAITSFNIDYYSIEELGKKETYKDSTYTPLIIDEAFLRGYAGQLNIEAGYRKLTWGRADSSGPLDVTNPIDYSDLRYITDLQTQKIARPMLHISYNAGSFSKLETVFIPNFAPHRFAQDGRWIPLQYSDITSSLTDSIQDPLKPYVSNLTIQEQIRLMFMFNEMSANFSPQFPDTSSIDNFQAGLRYTTTINSVDLGVQYYYGNLFRPNFTANGINNFTDELITWIFTGASIPPGPPDLNTLNTQIIYTRYHQIGIDYAQVISNFNIRAEFAVNLTEDITGKDGRYQNPFLAWSLGFDRDLFWGINLNMQCNETIRLMNSKVGDDPLFDSEANTNVTNTRLTARLSKMFFRDKLEPKTVFICDIENPCFYIIPSVSYTLHDFIFNVTAGFFAGNKTGELGQYYNNNFIRVGAVYKF